MSLLLSSFIIGFSAAASPGVIQTTVFQTSLLGKKRQGIVLASGVAAMNFIILVLSYFGISQFIKIPWLYYGIGMVGVGYMLFVGITGLLKSLGKLSNSDNPIEKQSFLNGMVLCALSPLTYVYFIGVATSFLNIKEHIFQTIIANSLSLAIGSFLCFVLVAYLGSAINKTGNKKIIASFNFLASLVIIIFSVRLFFNLLGFF
ncbi:LysE family transporter [Candidatus Gracilibacteria bacterium]|nr:LysE family transporter [Candidatus Gracilibacteria bacterium]